MKKNIKLNNINVFLKIVLLICFPIVLFIAIISDGTIDFSEFIVLDWLTNLGEMVTFIDFEKNRNSKKRNIKY